MMKNENETVEEKWSSRPDAQAFVLKSVRPNPGLLSDPDLDLSGVDSLLVIVRVLLASGCDFTGTSDTIHSTAIPSQERLTVEENAVLTAARKNLGWNKKFDALAKTRLLAVLHPNFAAAPDKSIFVYPGLEELLNRQDLSHLLQKSSHFAWTHCRQEALDDNSLQKPFGYPKGFFDNRNNRQVFRNLRTVVVDRTKDGKNVYETLGFHPPFLRFPVNAIAATQVEFKNTRRTIVTTNMKLFSKDEEPRVIKNRVMYRLLMVIRFGGSGGMQDRVRVYKEDGREIPSGIVGEFSKNLSSSVRKPEAWSFNGGGHFLLIYKRAMVKVELDDSAPEFDENVTHH